METEEKGKKILKGIVVSDKMQKTRVVKVTRFTKDRKYGKFFKVSKKFKAHDGKEEYKTGDAVFIKEAPPISRDKRWIISGKA